MQIERMSASSETQPISDHQRICVREAMELYKEFQENYPVAQPRDLEELETLCTKMCEIVPAVRTFLKKGRLRLPAETVGIMEKVEKPRSWQLLVSTLLVWELKCGQRGTTPTDFWRKLDVCPGAGKTLCIICATCLGKVLGLLDGVLIFAGENAMVKKQWSEQVFTLFSNCDYKSLCKTRRHAPFLHNDSNSRMLFGVTLQSALEKEFKAKVEQLPEWKNALARGRVLMVVDEGHHLTVDNTKTKHLEELVGPNLCILLTGTDDTSSKRLVAQAPLLYRLSYATALARGWVLNMEIVVVDVMIDKHGGEDTDTKLTPARAKQAIVPRGFSDTWTPDVIRQCLLHKMMEVACRQWMEPAARNLACQDGAYFPGTMIVFVPPDSGSFAAALNAAYGETRQDSVKETFFKTMGQHAFEFVKNSMLNDANYASIQKHLSELTARFYYATSDNEDLMQFTDDSLDSSRLHVCFTCGQAGEGYDNPSIKSVWYCFGFESETKTAQYSCRAIRPHPDDFKKIRRRDSTGQDRLLRTATIGFFELEEERLRNLHAFRSEDRSYEARDIVEDTQVQRRKVLLADVVTHSWGDVLEKTTYNRCTGDLGRLGLARPAPNRADEFSMMNGLSETEAKVVVRFKSNGTAKISRAQDAELRRKYKLPHGQPVPRKYEQTWRNYIAVEAQAPDAVVESIPDTMSASDVLYELTGKLKQSLAKTLVLECDSRGQERFIEQVLIETLRHLVALIKRYSSHGFDEHFALLHRQTYVDNQALRGCPHVYSHRGSTAPCQGSDCWCTFVTTYMPRELLLFWRTVVVPARLEYILVQCGHAEKRPVDQWLKKHLRKILQDDEDESDEGEDT